MRADDVDAVAAVYARRISILSECEIAPFVDAWARIDAEQALEEAKDMDLAWIRFPGPIVVESVGKNTAPLVWPHTPEEI